MDFSAVQSTDISIMNTIGGNHSLFADSFLSVLTCPYTWLALYAALFVMVIKNNEKVKHITLLFSMAFLCILLSGILDNVFIKPYFARLRPFADPAVHDLINTVAGVDDSGYSFFSAHSANTFAIATFLIMVVRSRLFSFTMIAWAAINAYSRIYLCAHYPSDVAAGILWGIFVGFIIYLVYRRISKKIDVVYNYVSSEYTPTGYSFGDIDMVMCVFVFTLVYAVLRAFI